MWHKVKRTVKDPHMKASCICGWQTGWQEMTPVGYMALHQMEKDHVHRSKLVVKEVTNE